MTKAIASSTIPAKLLLGRTAVDRIGEVEIIDEFKMHAPSGRWVLRLKLSPAGLAFSDFVPSETEWFVFVDPEYPFGEIDFFPSKTGGIDKTFPHQALNIEISGDDWRTGKVCLSEPFAAFGDTFFSNEPFASEERLAWHIKRALGWLQYASRNELLAKGHFFEMPVFENPVGDESLIVFSESDDSLDVWQDNKNSIGFFEYHVSSANNIFLVKKFLTLSKKPFLAPNWGDYIHRFQTPKKFGVWIKLESLPLVPPWQAPLTWGELKFCLQKQNIDLDESVDSLFSNRNGKERVDFLALIGFPIPDKIGEKYERYHWQGIKLPPLKFKDSSVNGFRPSKEAAGRANKNILTDSTPVEWIKSENWFPDQIRSRGSLPASILDKRILLIGAGAVGSAIAEMLVRGGLDRLTICDGDDVKAGNLVRHTLDLRHVSENKAAALATHLNQISPYAKIKYQSDKFPPKTGFPLMDFDLIIDCTASQRMLAALADFESPEDVDFVSLSMSFGAKRLYFFSSRGKRFPFEQYRKNITPWLEKDFSENKNEIAPREGIGCWHPVFPARSDDVWLLTATGFKLMTQAISNGLMNDKFKVFEQNETFVGIKEISLD